MLARAERVRRQSACSIGDNVKIQNNVSVYDEVTLEDDVFCGPSMVFTNVRQPQVGGLSKGRVSRPTLVRRGATLGANCTIVCGVEIGEHAFVGGRRRRSIGTCLAFALMVGRPCPADRMDDARRANGSPYPSTVTDRRLVR